MSSCTKELGYPSDGKCCNYTRSTDIDHLIEIDHGSVHWAGGRADLFAQMVMSSNGGPIKYLGTSANRLSGEDVALVAEALRTLRHLKFVHIVSLRIVNPGIIKSVESDWAVFTDAIIDLVEACHQLEKLEILGTYGFGPNASRRLCRAATQHPTLKIFDTSLMLDNASPIVELIATNRTIHTLKATLYKPDPAAIFTDDEPFIVDLAPALDRALEDNWKIRTVFFWSSDSVRPIALRFKRSYQHVPDYKLFLNYCLALVPLRIPTHELLEILGWLPAFSKRFSWGVRGLPTSRSFDPFQAVKVRLIEGIMKSYNQVKQPH